MKSSRVQRWDLVVGAVASLISIAGLLLSVALGNTAAFAGASVDHKTQKFLVVLGGAFLLLVVIKTGVRCRRGNVQTCSRSLGRWRP